MNGIEKAAKEKENIKKNKTIKLFLPKTQGIKD